MTFADRPTRYYRDFSDMTLRMRGKPFIVLTNARFCPKTKTPARQILCLLSLIHLGYTRVRVYSCIIYIQIIIWRCFCLGTQQMTKYRQATRH